MCACRVMLVLLCVPLRLPNNILPELAGGADRLAWRRMEGKMAKADFVRENDAARTELNELVAGLDAASFSYPVGSGWTIASSLCHLAFWDQRALFLLQHWEKGGNVEMPPLDAQSVNSINQAVNLIGLNVPGPAAARLAADSAAAVDACVAGIGEELAGRIQAAGFERYLRRYLHRREHLGKMREALGARTAKRK